MHAPALQSKNATSVGLKVLYKSAFTWCSCSSIGHLGCAVGPDVEGILFGSVCFAVDCSKGLAIAAVDQSVLVWLADSSVGGSSTIDCHV